MSWCRGEAARGCNVAPSFLWTWLEGLLGLRRCGWHVPLGAGWCYDVLAWDRKMIQTGEARRDDDDDDDDVQKPWSFNSWRFMSHDAKRSVAFLQMSCDVIQLKPFRFSINSLICHQMANFYLYLNVWPEDHTKQTLPVLIYSHNQSFHRLLYISFRSQKCFYS